MLNCCYPYSPYLYLMSPTSFITSTATFTCTSPALYIYLYHICTNHHYCCSCSYCSVLLLMFLLFIPLISYCIYPIYVFYITTIHMHILCTLLLLHFWLDANCFSLPQYLYSVQ